MRTPPREAKTFTVKRKKKIKIYFVHLSNHLSVQDNLTSILADVLHLTLLSVRIRKNKEQNHFVWTQMEIHSPKKQNVVAIWIDHLIILINQNNMKSISTAQDGKLVYSCALGKFRNDVKDTTDCFKQFLLSDLATCILTPLSGSVKGYCVEVYGARRWKMMSDSVFLFSWWSLFPLLTLFLWSW